MDDLKRRIFEEIWQKHSTDFDFGGTFLDTLYQEGILDPNEYEQLKNKRGNDLLNFIYDALKTNDVGYSVFLTELQDNYEWIFKIAKQLESDENTKLIAHNDALRKGDVPHKPQYYIERTQLLQKIRGMLMSSPCSGSKIVLYGMNGIGKSCLASAAIDEKDLLLNSFDNKVFWINIGKVDQEQLFEHMYRLYRKIVLFTNEAPNFPREKPSNIDEMKDNLVMLFRKNLYSRSLIVLDNVCSKRVIEYFDVGCSLLITAQEKISINQKNVFYMSVQDGFSEEESLRLFANCLEISYEEIKKMDGPSAVQNWCKGDLVTVFLCATLMDGKKEKLKEEDGWESFIRSLNVEKLNLMEKRSKAINLCLDNLDSELRLKFEDFAVFVYDINITPQVLTVLWGMEEARVDQVLRKLLQKCLIVSEYSDLLKTEVYGIHHVFLDFLKSRLDEVGTINLHRKVIKSYKEYSNLDYAELPNDNYIFQYIGYHLFEAKMFEEFNIYFDLNFIGAKIRATGIADVLWDFSTYKDFITKKDETLEDKLTQFTSFVEMFGQNLHKYPKTDIVQSGLQLPKEHAVYKAACRIAKDRCAERLYFTTHAPYESNYYTHMLHVKGTFKAACFTHETNEILIGMETGAIEMWETQYPRKMQTFTGHAGSIVSLKLNASRDKFLSISADGILKLWNLADKNGHGHSHNTTGHAQSIPSPRVKQDNHRIFFGSDFKVDYSHTFRRDGSTFTSAAFCNYSEVGETIASGTSLGKVIIWSDNGNEPLFRSERFLLDSPVNCVAFSNDNAIVIASCGSDVFLLDANSGCEFLSKLRSRDKSRINALHVVPFEDVSSVVAVQDSKITVWSWKIEHEHGKEKSIVYENCGLECEMVPGSKFVCSTITEKYLVAGSTDKKIRMWDIERKVVIEEFIDQTGHIVCLDACVNGEDNSIHILLTGFENEMVKMWHVLPQNEKLRTKKSLPMFAAHWNANDSRSSTAGGNRPPLIAVPNTDNKVQILKGHNLVVETEPQTDGITAITFSLCGDYVVYGTTTGAVFLYKIKCKEIRRIMSLEGVVTYLEAIDMGGNHDVDELLVAATDAGKLSVYHNGECRMMIGMTDNLQISVAPILRSYPIRSAKNKLLTVSRRKMTIKCWDLDAQQLKSDVLCSVGCTESKVTTSCISRDESLVCVTTDSNLQVFHVIVVENNIEVKAGHAMRLKDQICCCCFSHANQYLALGCDNGNIVIWDVGKKVVHVTLELHTVAVRNLHFSPSELILISVAEQVAWWNLKHVPMNSATKMSRSRSGSMRLPSRPLSFELPTLLSSLSIGTSWTSKKGPEPTPYLLSAVKLHGAYADSVSYSQDFESFLTVDNHGEIYILDVMDGS